MAILLECPLCHKKQKLKNKKCVCGADLDKLKRQKEKVKYWNDYRIPYKDEYGVINCREFGRACKKLCVNGHCRLQTVTTGGSNGHTRRPARCPDEGLQES